MQNVESFHDCIQGSLAGDTRVSNDKIWSIQLFP